MASVLPPNASPLERALEQAAQAVALPRPIRDLWDPDTCPVDFLPWLAWGLSIENWRTDWPETVKRARIRDAIYIQTIKGTRKSIEDVIGNLGSYALVREWWEQDPPAAPHTFEVIIELSSVQAGQQTADFAQSLKDEIDRTKPVRSHFTLTQSLRANRSIAVATEARAGELKRIEGGAVQPATPAPYAYLTEPDEESGDYLLTDDGDYLYILVN